MCGTDYFHPEIRDDVPVEHHRSWLEILSYQVNRANFLCACGAVFTSTQHYNELLRDIRVSTDFKPPNFDIKTTAPALDYRVGQLLGFYPCEAPAIAIEEVAPASDAEEEVAPAADVEDGAEGAGIMQHIIFLSSDDDAEEAAPAAALADEDAKEGAPAAADAEEGAGIIMQHIFFPRMMMTRFRGGLGGG